VIDIVAVEESYKHMLAIVVIPTGVQVLTLANHPQPRIGNLACSGDYGRAIVVPIVFRDPLIPGDIENRTFVADQFRICLCCCGRI
jgi:hypothetical protein